MLVSWGSVYPGRLLDACDEVRLDVSTTGCGPAGHRRRSESAGSHCPCISHPFTHGGDAEILQRNTEPAARLPTRVSTEGVGGGERTLLATIHNWGSRAAPAHEHGLRITMLQSDFPHTFDGVAVYMAKTFEGTHTGAGALCCAQLCPGLPGMESACAAGQSDQLSHIGAVAFSGHARRRAPPLHSARQGFGNAVTCFWPIQLVNFGRSYVAYYRIAQISLLNLACAGPPHATQASRLPPRVLHAGTRDGTDDDDVFYLWSYNADPVVRYSWVVSGSSWVYLALPQI
jgi:hypothetical protein